MGIEEKYLIIIQVVLRTWVQSGSRMWLVCYRVAGSLWQLLGGGGDLRTWGPGEGPWEHALEGICFLGTMR